MWYENNILFWRLVTLVFFIYHLIVEIILTQYQKIMNQTDTFKTLETKLTHNVQVMDQNGNLTYN